MQHVHTYSIVIQNCTFCYNNIIVWVLLLSVISVSVAVIIEIKCMPDEETQGMLCQQSS